VTTVAAVSSGGGGISNSTASRTVTATMKLKQHKIHNQPAGCDYDMTAITQAQCLVTVTRCMNSKIKNKNATVN